MTNPFVGSWKLLSAVYERDGQAAYPFGPEPVGLLIYDELGNMSVQIMHSSRADSSDSKSVRVNRAAFSGYLGYYGKSDLESKT
jgi:hypothetical protein